MKNVIVIAILAWFLGLATTFGATQNPQQVWQWFERTYIGGPAANPSGRWLPAVAFDPTGKTGLLFAGEVDSHSQAADTWIWESPGWVKQKPSTNPDRRFGHAMAYDAKRKVFVMFGGKGWYWNQWNWWKGTWEWDGTNWKKVQPTTEPSPRTGHAMTYDSRRGVVVLFGGWDDKNHLSDTWEWDGTTWTKRSPAAAPSARAAHAMTYDSQRGVVVLFGGHDGTSALGGPWEYDGSSWTIPFPPPPYSPSGRYQAGLVYDNNRKVSILFGGRDAAKASLNDTHEWNGTSWTALQTASAPKKRYGFGMFFDSNLGCPVVFGGWDGKYQNDTWTLSSYATPDFAFAGKGHARGGLDLRFLSRPLRGTNLTITFQNAPSWVYGAGNPGKQGFNLLVMGLPLSSPHSLPTTVLSDTGFLYALPLMPAQQVIGVVATFQFPIPNIPILKGQTFCLQGASYETTQTFRLTDAVLVTIQ
jgi:galactose oxidase-like protein